MFKKKATIEQNSQDEQANVREKMDVTLHKLQTLKYKISEIRQQCEEIKKQILENKVPATMVSAKQVSENKVSLCSKCGKAIESNLKVVVKDSAGIERHHYHTKCFQALLK